MRTKIIDFATSGGQTLKKRMNHEAHEGHDVKQKKEKVFAAKPPS